MEQQLIIEYHGKLQDFQTSPVRIGSAPDNDLIITGAGIADHHAEITTGKDGLTLTVFKRVYLNGKAILTTGKCTANDRLQIGLETLRLNPITRVNTEKKKTFWLLFSHPLAVFGWFLLAIALPTWEDYLNSPQTYIPNYEIPLIVIFWILSLSFVLHSMVFTITRRYLILPVLGIVSAFISMGTLADWLADWYGFRFNGSFGEIASNVGAFLFFALIWRAFLQKFVPLCGRALWKVLFITLVPILLFNVYSYLKQNDFFKKRSGSYPSYHITLQNDVPSPNKIKSIEGFFTIDKTEQQN